MIVTGCLDMSEDSEEDIENGDINIYRRKYQLLMERCEVIQQDNERLVHRIHKCKMLVKRLRKHRQALMTRLDMYNEDWRTMALQISLDEPNSFSSATTQQPVKQEKSSHKTTSTPVGKNPAVEKGSRKSAVAGGSSATKKKGGKSGERVERDPNAPKRPANPFFQFCQEQRPLVMERLGSEQKSGETETSKQELTKQLASKWKTLNQEDKKVYYEMYEKSKEKYAMEMQIYSTKIKLEDNTS